MNLKLKFSKIVIFFMFGLSVSAQSSPVVSKVEPPNWWANHSINAVRLLIRGENLSGANVNSADKNLKTSNVKVNSRGDYLFVDVSIEKNAKVGKYPLEVVGNKGKTSFQFEIKQPLDVNKNFQGITNDDVVYLIMPDRFSDGDLSNNKDVDRKNPRAWHGGDLRGIINHLDYLQELGITAIWLTPWYENTDSINNCGKPWCPATSYHGYGATDYFAVENHFGTMRDLRELVEKAHSKNIKVIQDQVANHVGKAHVWTKSPPLDNWFNKFEQNTFNNSVLLSPNSSDAERNNLINGWFDEGLPDLNQSEPEVSKYLIQNALWWIGETGIDGIRQDTIQYMPRTFIRDWSSAINKQYPKFYMVGEVFERDSVQTAFFQGGKKGFDDVDTKLPGVFDFKLWETSLEVFTNKKPMRALRDVLKYDGLYPNPNNIIVLQNNHDTKRFMSLEGATLESAKLHAAFLLSTRGIPQLYYGEELAMRGGEDPDNRRDFSGGFPNDEKNAFTKEGRTSDEQKMFEWTQKWIKLRRDNIGIQKGATTDLFYDDDVYVFERNLRLVDYADVSIVAINKSDKVREVAVNFKVPESIGLTKVYLKSLISDGEKVKVESDKITFTLQPKSAVVYGLKP